MSADINKPVIPAYAGIQIRVAVATVLDTRLRGYDVSLIAEVRAKAQIEGS